MPLPLAVLHRLLVLLVRMHVRGVVASEMVLQHLDHWSTHVLDSTARFVRVGPFQAVVIIVLLVPNEVRLVIMPILPK